MSLTTDAYLTADLGVARLFLPLPCFVEIAHEIISMAILLLSTDSFKKNCCQLQANVCAPSTGYCKFGNFREGGQVN